MVKKRFEVVSVDLGMVVNAFLMGNENLVTDLVTFYVCFIIFC